MARSKLTDLKDDIIDDGGSILWSFIKGEQLEFPITLSFIEDATIAGYKWEAVVVEAANEIDQTSPPTTIKNGGHQAKLVVRVPTNAGTWSAVAAYNREDVVLYNGLYYRLLYGAARISALLPNVDPLWEVTTLNIIYVQFPSTLGYAWTIQPTTTFSSYGFFELRVTEPTMSLFTRTWKPVRGMVEILFSPTDLVADV